jgi:DNA-binding SARP family transcriptional activator
MVDDRIPDLPRLLRQLRRREARRRGGPELTYRELAARTGWSLGIIAQYFSGKTLPPVDRFDMLVRLLGAAPAEQGALATARDRIHEYRRRAAPARPGGQRTQPAQPPDRCPFRLLGPVQVVGPAGVARLVGARQRALVGLLALKAGQVVPRHRLVDALWGDEPPATAVSTLYSHVARLRRVLDRCGLRGVLRTQPPGYLLAVDPELVDATRFETQLVAARTAFGDGRTVDAVACLRDGLALWRGNALIDAEPSGWGAAEADRLDEARLHAQEELWSAQLRLGEHVEAAAELAKVLVSHPGRERSVELLMLARYRSGRPADALEAYQQLREHLAEQLGVGPSPRLQSLHTAILRGEAAVDPTAADPAGRRPAQLPSRTGHFVGRGTELAVLDGLVSSQAQVGVISGPAGMGKTALAVQWASQSSDRYPDGQLFIDLRGHDPAAALPVAEALTYALVGLGLPAAQLPADPAALVGLYRSALHHRRVLVLLDNAASTEQVAPLVPPAPSQLLVTSRSRLPGLAVAHEVVAVDLDVLPYEDALTLLRRVLGNQRVRDESDAAGRLVERCGRMPLALRIAAAKLMLRRAGKLAALVAELDGTSRLDVLSVPGDSISVRAVFASAYRALNPPAAGMFRLLGQHPGTTFSTALAATLAAVPTARAAATLDELAAAQLVADAGPDRFRFHDLLGVYARECADPAERTRSAGRIIDWYLTVGDAANRVIDPARDRAGPVSVSPPIAPPFPADREQALAFLDAEHANLLPVVRLAAAHGDDQAGWRLVYLLSTVHLLRGRWSALVELSRWGLAAAQRLADPTAEALMRSWLGMACNATRVHDEALEHLGVALRLMRAAGDERGQAMALNNIAIAYGQLGRLDEALETHRKSLALHTANGHWPGVATALNNIGDTYLRLRQPGPAREHLHRALALTSEHDLPGHAAYHLHSLGEVHRADADPDGALGWLNAALAIRRRLGERRLEAETLNLIGLTHGDRGEDALAAEAFERALALSRELGDHALAATTRAHLDRLKNPPA